MGQGVIGCLNQWDEGFCWEKVSELLITTACLILTLFQLALHCLDLCQFWSLKYLIYYTVVLTLLFNFVHDLLFEVYVLFDLQTLFFNVYFVTIIYYYGDRIIKKAYRDNFQIPFTILRTVYGTLLLGHIVLFFYSVYTTSDKCVDVWYLIVRTVGSVLGVGMLAFGIVNQKRQRERLIQVSMVKQIGNPFGRLWIWIAVNIIGQLINLVRSFIFAFDANLDCMYNKTNPNLNYMATFLILITTYYMPLLSTLYFFWAPCAINSSRPQVQTMEDSGEEYGNRHGVQMMTVEKERTDSF